MNSLSLLWDLPPDELSLGDDEVHVWLSDLNRPPSQVEELFATLTRDEQERAGRFHFKRDRDHFIVGRGVLRALLGFYLNLAPATLQFSYNSYGKPSLVSEAGRESIRFNLSHSDGLALIALTRSREIGVDLERIRPGVASEQLSEGFFSAEEIRALRELPKEMHEEAFFNCWTRKEAYVKARGQGLSIPLDQFEVSLVPGEVAALRCVRGDPQEPSRWSLSALFPAPEFVAAVAVEGSGWRLNCWRWR